MQKSLLSTEDSNYEKERESRRVVSGVRRSACDRMIMKVSHQLFSIYGSVIIAIVINRKIYHESVF